MSSPGPISGFPELLPAQRFVEQQVVDTLREAFELHGFAGVETRSVEPLDQLLRKGDTSKEVYLLRRLHEESPEGHTGLGLHFDLTVPFARYVLEHAGKLAFPFRRYQVQRAWRGERPQEGRFREFTQADIDVVGRDELPFHHDIEVARVMLDAMGRLAQPSSIGLPPVRFQVNNRKVVQGYYEGLGLSDPAEVMRLVDKLDKVAADRVRGMLVDEAGLGAADADRVLALAEVRGSDEGVADQVRDLGVEHPLLEEGLAELVALLRGCADLTGPRVRVEADLSVARGLDYYTGTVYETRLEGLEGLGSICSGGRYDSLASLGRTSYPGVGISLGVSRLLISLMERSGLTADRSVPSAVLVALVDEESRPASDAVAASLRARSIPCEVAPAPQRFGKQIRYAERRGIPWVWFPATAGGTHEIKDIRSGQQAEADPDTWEAPVADLRPRVRPPETIDGSEQQ